jgi:outer membrane murein-binding lipoprotein Lpp
VGGAAYAKADSLEDIMQVGIDRTKAALTSQGKIDRLADETRDLLADYKTVMKQVEGLRVYNARLDRQIANQERRIDDIDQSDFRRGDYSTSNSATSDANARWFGPVY